jgi:hypothetical protein
MREIRNVYNSLVGKTQGSRDDLRDLAVDGRITMTIIMVLRKTYYESVKWLTIRFSGGLCDDLSCSTEFTKKEFLGQVSNYNLVKEDSVCLLLTIRQNRL